MSRRHRGERDSKEKRKCRYMYKYWVTFFQWTWRYDLQIYSVASRSSIAIHWKKLFLYLLFSNMLLMYITYFTSKYFFSHTTSIWKFFFNLFIHRSLNFGIHRNKVIKFTLCNRYWHRMIFNTDIYIVYLCTLEGFLIQSDIFFYQNDSHSILLLFSFRIEETIIQLNKYL